MCVKITADPITIRESYVFIELAQPYLVEEEVTLHQPYDIGQVKSEINQAKTQHLALEHTCSEINVGSEPSREFENRTSIQGLELKEILNFYYPYTNNPKYGNDHNEYSLTDARRLCDEHGFTLVQPRNETELYAVMMLAQSFGIKRALLNVRFDPHRSLNRLEDYDDIVMVPSVLYPHVTVTVGTKATPDKLVDDRNSVYVAYGNGTLHIGREYHDGAHDSNWTEKFFRRNPNFKWPELMSPKIKGGVICQLKHVQRHKGMIQQMREQRIKRRRSKESCDTLAEGMRNTTKHLEDQLEQTMTKYGLEYGQSRDRHKRGWGVLLGMPRMLKLSSKVIRSGKKAYKGYKMIKVGRKIGSGIDVKEVNMGKKAVGTLATLGGIASTVGQVIKIGKAVYAPLKPLTAGLRADAVLQTPLKENPIEQIINSVEKLGQDLNARAFISEILGTFQQTTQLIYAGIEELDDTLQSLAHNQIPGRFLNGIRDFFTRSDNGHTATRLKEEDPISVEPEVEDEKTLHVLMTFQQGQEKWKLIQVIPLPTYEKGYQELIVPTTEYALIDREGSKYIPLTKIQAQDCKTEVCAQTAPMESVRDDPCTMKHYREEIDITSECQIEVTKAKPMFKTTDIGIIYAVPSRIKVKIVCSEEEEGSQDKDLEGKGLIRLPPGCELVMLHPYMKVAGPITHTIESLDENYNSTRWNNHLQQQRGIHYNLTKVTQREFSQAKEEIDQEMYISVLVTGIVLTGLIILICLVCLSLQHHENRIDRRKDVDYRQENMYVELRSDFERFTDKVGKLVSIMEMKTSEEEEHEAKLYPACRISTGSEEEHDYVSFKDENSREIRNVGKKAWQRVKRANKEREREKNAPKRRSIFRPRDLKGKKRGQEYLITKPDEKPPVLPL